MVVAWEAVEELLVAVPDGPAKQVLRLTAAGFSDAEIAARLRLSPPEVAVLRARGRIRVLTAGIGQPGSGEAPFGGSGDRGTGGDEG